MDSELVLGLGLIGLTVASGTAATALALASRRGGSVRRELIRALLRVAVLSVSALAGLLAAMGR